MLEVRIAGSFDSRTVERVLVRKGSVVQKGKSLAILKGGATVRAPDGGTVTSVAVAEGDTVESNALVAVVEQCGHLQCFNGVCGICGSPVESSGDHVMTSHTTTALTVHRSVAETAETKARKELLAQRRLVLILDLDETLIQSSMDRTNLSFASHFEDESLRPARRTETESKAGGESTGADESAKNAAEHKEGDDQRSNVVEGLHQFSLKGPNGQQQSHFVKLRPHLREFLEALKDKYEMHVYTHGVRNYANKIAAIIDPEGTYFQGRVLSRNESGSEKKSLERLFPFGCLWDMVLIVDDNHNNVWQGCPNVVVIDKFQFFAPLNRSQPPYIPYDPSSSLAQKKSGQRPPSATADAVVPGAVAPVSKDGSAGPAETAATKRRTWPYNEWMLEDVNLLFVRDILCNTHREFFGALDAGNAAKGAADVRTIMDKVRTTVLQGTHILFTGALNKNVRAPDTYIWRMAHLCGAACHTELDSDVTHVVAGRQTVTLKEARQRGVHFVTPAWLFVVFHSWAKPSEEQFKANSGNTAAYSDEALMMLESHAKTLFLAYSREHRQKAKRTAQERQAVEDEEAESYHSDSNTSYGSDASSYGSSDSEDSDEEVVGEGAQKKRKLDLLSEQLLDGW